MIVVTVQAQGPMREYFPGPDQELELPDGATLGDLFERIDQLHGERLAGSIWNHQVRKFRGPVVVKAGSRVLTSREAKLQDRQVVSLFKAVVGG
jgi:molybdopterin converting factor small subunit